MLCKQNKGGYYSRLLCSMYLLCKPNRCRLWPPGLHVLPNSPSWLPRDRRFPNLANIGKNAKCRLRTLWCLLRNWPENTYQVGIAESSHCTRRVRKSLAYCTSFSQVPSVMTSTLTGVLRMFHFVKLARCDTEIFWAVSLILFVKPL